MFYGAKSFRPIFLFSVITAFVFAGCGNPALSLLNKVPVNSIEVQVLDVDGNPVAGAQVEASNGRRVSTNQNGIASVRFGSVGIHSVTVLADNYLPANQIVTMPADRGKTITTQLVNHIDFSGITFGAINMYPMMFNYLFTGYGYQLELDEYPEGGWTAWQLDEEGELILKKAFLKKLENGQEWWQISMRNQDEEEESYIAEVLFSEGRQNIVRMREKIGTSEAQEKPVSEGWYNSPQMLTSESIDGALTESNVSVQVPVDTFTADLLNFGIAPSISMKMWRVPSTLVPGGVVKYQTTGDEEIISSMVLLNYGTDATTVLNSFE